MFTLKYRAYGLTLESTARIAALHQLSSPWSCQTDVSFDVGAAPDWANRAMKLSARPMPTRRSKGSAGEAKFSVIEYGAGEFFQLCYGDGSRFLVDAQGTRIWGQPGPGLTNEDAFVYLVGPVMGFVLRRRGCLALHAASVVFKDRAVALVGTAGSGKSTTAASLALCGRPVLCDDISVIDQEPGGITVLPGYPRVCLWPDSVKTILGSGESLPLIVSGWNKQFLALDGTRAVFSPAPKPLAAIYVLASRGDGPTALRIERLNPKESALELLRNTYMNWLLDRRQRAAEFAAVAKLASEIDCFRITPSLDPAHLGALVSLVETHALGLLSQTTASSRNHV